MYCNTCGQTMADESRYCSHCGRPVSRLHGCGRLNRPHYGRKIAGVCAGIAEHIDLDASLIRILWVLVTLTSGFFPGIVGYVIAWIIIPDEAVLPPIPSVPIPPVPQQHPVAG
jgi:phage shock protein C